MSVNEWGPDVWLLMVLSALIAVGLPVATRVKLATPAMLRERILSSRPGEVLARIVAACASGCAVGLLLASGGARFPILWGTAFIALSIVVSSLWYAVLYCRTRSRMESELEVGFTSDDPGQP